MSSKTCLVSEAVLTMLVARQAGATLCPSEVARRLAGEGGDWRGEMAAVHAAVDGLLDERQVVLSWKGERLVRREGPYRIGRPE